jgi:hypothetical protein
VSPGKAKPVGGRWRRRTFHSARRRDIACLRDEGAGREQLEMPARGFWAYWYLSVPNVVLAALIYLLIARCILSLVLRDGNMVMRVLSLVTGPVFVPVAAVTPRVVPKAIVMVFAIVWLYVIRMGLSVATPFVG